MTKTDTQAHLIRAHEALGNLIARDTERNWARFYDAMRFIDGLEDAAHDALVDGLSQMGLDSDGDPGEPEPGYHNAWGDPCLPDAYRPMTAIYMPVSA